MPFFTIRYPDKTRSGGGGGGATGPPGPEGPEGPVGPAGPDGADGKTVRNGSGAPAGGLGVDGDFYIDTAADDLYGPKSGGAWGSPVSLIGPMGPAAVAGAIPSEYVEMTTPRTTTSASLVDITGATLDLTLESSANILVVMTTHSDIASGGGVVLGLAINIDGVDHDETDIHLTAASQWGPAAIIHRSVTPLAAGTYTVKGRFRRISGSGTPEVTRVDLFAMSLQGAKGDTGEAGPVGFSVVAATGLVNGSNKVFTFPGTDPVEGYYAIIADGQFLTYGDDYTRSGTTVTIVAGREAPALWVKGMFGGGTEYVPAGTATTTQAQWTATASQTVFEFPDSGPITDGMIYVCLNGVILPPSEYSYDSDNLTLDTGAALDVVVGCSYYSAGGTGGTPAIDEFTATADQTQFYLAHGGVAITIVSVNGVVQTSGWTFVMPNLIYIPIAPGDGAVVAVAYIY